MSKIIAPSFQPGQLAPQLQRGVTLKISKGYEVLETDLDQRSLDMWKVCRQAGRR